MTEKKFSLEHASETSDYRGRILNIVNGRIENHVRAKMIDPDATLHRELHEFRLMDVRKEIEECEPIRRDICKSFGISFDDEHVYIHDIESDSNSNPKSQRALRAFYIVIDTENKEGFYGEGRTIHNTLLVAIGDIMNKKNPDLSSDFLLDNLAKDEKRFLVFKGFLSTKEFKELSDSSRRNLEKRIHDVDGSEIETADTWFLTGHNLD